MKSRKRAFAIGFFILAIGLAIWWAAEGGKFFTTSQTMVEEKDELFGTTVQSWKKEFTPGLELIGPLVAAFLVGGLWMTYSAKKDDQLNRA